MQTPFSRALLLGAALWLLATLAIRAAGQLVFRPDPVSLTAALLLGGAGMALLGPLLRLRLTRDPRDADAVALGLVLPGMFADAAVALGFRHVYPNLSPALGNDFAALMLWYYAVAALAITLHARRGAWRDGEGDAGRNHGRSGRDRGRDHDQGLARAP